MLVDNDDEEVSKPKRIYVEISDGIIFHFIIIIIVN